MGALKGSLRTIGLRDLLKFIGEQRQSGILELTNDGARGLLEFDDGRLVALRLGDRQGLQAFMACAVEFADAEFNFTDGEPLGEHTLNLGPTEVDAMLTLATANVVDDQSASSRVTSLVLQADVRPPQALARPPQALALPPRALAIESSALPPHQSGLAARMAAVGQMSLVPATIPERASHYPTTGQTSRDALSSPNVQSHPADVRRGLPRGLVGLAAVLCVAIVVLLAVLALAARFV